MNDTAKTTDINEEPMMKNVCATAESAPIFHTRKALMNPSWSIMKI